MASSASLLRVGEVVAIGAGHEKNEGSNTISVLKEKNH
jgi:hypothetical protein